MINKLFIHTYSVSCVLPARLGLAADLCVALDRRISLMRLTRTP